MISPAALPFTFAAPLVTDRLTIRPMTTEDVDDVYAYWSIDEVMRFELHEPRTREETAARLAEFAKATTLAVDGDYWQLAIVREDGHGGSRTIGDIYFTILRLDYSRAEIGWMLHPEFQGHGYATEAAGAVIDLAFRGMRLHRVVAQLDPRNDASVALCHRLGMREEARFVRDVPVRGEWGDTGLFAVLEEEWFAAHPA